MGFSVEAAEQFDLAVNLAPGNAAYHFNLANVEYMLRHDLATAWQIGSDEILRCALEEFRAASRLAPDNLEYARAYAETFYGVPEPDWAEAAAAWQHVLALAPQSDFVYLQLARVSLKCGDATSARRCLGKVRDARHDGVKCKLLAQTERL